MKVTVAICTWNRSDSLRRTLTSLAEMQLPAGLAWEVLVVDNNSSDDTAAVANGFSDRLPVRCVLERAQGLSHARNCATHAAQGDYIVWTDDDVLVAPDWLASYCAAFERWPDASLFGGRVRPEFDPPVPAWLAQGWQLVPSAFAAVDFGPVPLPLTAERLPFGANFAMRRREQLQHMFDPKLGASPQGRYYSEEVTMMQRLLDAGGQGWWVPDATLRHCIPPERMTLAYLARYFERTGRTDYYLNWSQRARTVRRLFGRPPWVWRSLVERELRYWLCRATRPAGDCLLALRDRSVAHGVFDEAGRW